jgi:hypothetical protein
VSIQIAKRQGVVNPENTFYSVKRFIGRRMEEIGEESKARARARARPLPRHHASRTRIAAKPRRARLQLQLRAPLCAASARCSQAVSTRRRLHYASLPHASAR